MTGERVSIDRRALVGRHDVRVRAYAPDGSLSLGNGRFGATVDATGLQTFPDQSQAGVPLGLQAQWGWRTAPNPERFTLADTYNFYESGDRRSPYPEITPSDAVADPSRFRAAATWLRENPHRLQLAFIGLCRLIEGQPRDLEPAELHHIDQRLDLWTGRIVSTFILDDTPVEVETFVDAHSDTLVTRITSKLLSAGKLGLRIRFPGPSVHFCAAWTWDEEAHRSRLIHEPDHDVVARSHESDRYHVAIRSSGAPLRETGVHCFVLATAADEIRASFSFSPEPAAALAPDEMLAQRTKQWWADFWTRGMAIDFSASTDPRAAEIERRTILSQFLTAGHCAGDVPPQETGFVTNSWHGKFHLEMHLWHAAHFAWWDRPDLLERSMSWYLTHLDDARATAERQAFAGARWPKMVGPDAREAPSDIGVFLIWQQPHPILFAELLRRAGGGAGALARYGQLVDETAGFMLDFLEGDEAGGLHLRTPLIPAQECYREQRELRIDPTFELAYWRFALSIAREWRERTGREACSRLDTALECLAIPHVQDGMYSAITLPPYAIYEDHPSMLAALGLLPMTPGIEREVMERTLDDVLARWDWATSWGWDCPMVAMTAARLGRHDQAIEILLMDTPKNAMLPSGHNYQGPPLPVYLPGNGAFLLAIAMIARGWEEVPEPGAGFPAEWGVRVEGGQLTP